MADEKFPTKYYILRRMWSNERRRDLEVGETVTLEELNDDQVAKHLAEGTFMLAPTSTLAQRVAASKLADNEEPEPAKSKKAK